MRHWNFVLFGFAGYVATLWAEPFDQAEVTKTINLVSLLPQDVRAEPGDLVKGDTALKTGGNSRAELQFPDLTITRVGSNALFRFIAGTREMVLDSGTMLFSSPKGAGGGKVRAGAVAAAVSGSDFLISNAGRVKVICLSHKVLVYFTANPKIRAVLLPGQMLDIVPGAEKKMPPIATINLGTLVATSKLGEAGGFGPFPNQTILAYNVNKQGRGFVPANAILCLQTILCLRTSILRPRPLKPRVPPRSPITIPLPRSLRPRPLKRCLPPRPPITILPRNQQPRRPPPARRQTRPAVELAGTAGTTQISGISRIAAIAGTRRDEQAIAGTAGTTRISGISRIAAIAGTRRDEQATSSRSPSGDDESRITPFF